MRAQAFVLAFLTLASTQAFADSELGVATCRAAGIEIKLATTNSKRGGFGIADLKTKVNGKVVESEISAEATEDNLKSKSGLKYPNLFAVAVKKNKAVSLVNVHITGKSIADANHDDAVRFVIFKGKSSRTVKGMCHFDKNDIEAFNRITGESIEGTDQEFALATLNFDKCRDLEVVYSKYEDEPNQWEMTIKAYSKRGVALVGGESDGKMVNEPLRAVLLNGRWFSLQSCQLLN